MFRRPLCLGAPVLAAAFLAPPSASADVLVKYGFENNFDASNVDANLTASTITPTNLGTLGAVTNAGHGFTTATAATPAVDAPLDGSTRWTYWTYGATDGSANTLAAALTNGDYYEFTVTPDANVKYTLSTLTFNVDAMVSSTSAALYMLVDANNNGYAASDQIGSTATITTTTAGSRTITFTSAFADLTTATTIRVYVSDNQGNSTNTRRWFVIDNLELNGTTTLIPEPASLALVALGGLCLLPRRRGA